MKIVHTMRRKDREISTQEAQNILQSAQYGILSVSSLHNEPYGVPLNFCVLDDAIYFHCAAEGRKISILAQNKQVSFCVVGKSEVLPEKFGMRYESVIVSGTAEEVADREKQLALEGMLKKYSSPYFQEGLEQIKLNISKTKVYRILIETMSGKACK
jgi:nitroimidazol reductase NimA-like FMN-containing flavoprotein (pyridoxamine 5'-phosphate oxidase superfamily)